MKITTAIQVCQSLFDDETRKREVADLLDALQAYSLKEGLILTESEEKTETILADNQHYIIHIIPI